MAMKCVVSHTEILQQWTFPNKRPNLATKFQLESRDNIIVAMDC
jgi:hypothetical protein